MKKAILFAAIIFALSINIASAQNGKLVFGPLDGDSTGAIVVENGAELTIPVWIRTAPGVAVVGIHWPLSTDDNIVASRDGGSLFDPFSGWDDVSFLAPNPDNIHPGYTNQSILGIKDLIGLPDTVDAIQTNGEWQQVAEFYITTTGDNPVDTLFSEALIAGSQPDNGGFVWADFYQGELPAESFEYDFVGIIFASNVDPVWCPVDTEYCGDVGATLCIPLCGTDENSGDDLHIVQISGGGEYTEEVGGPGGYTSGTWCGNLPEGMNILTFELRDNVSEGVPLEITVEMRPPTLDIACVEGFPGGLISIPVSLHTCSFQMGGMQALIAWDSTAMSLADVEPTGRIDDGNEYWNVNLEVPCYNCPLSARIVWYSDINNGVHHSPAYAGDDPVFFITFLMDDDLEYGTVIPVFFYIDETTDNTISDSTGFNWFRPGLNDGCIEVVDPFAYKGDPNMNGRAYEIGDAILVVRYLIYGDLIWTENGVSDDEIQESSADLNGNGFVDIADLVLFINIIRGVVEPPKPNPASPVAEISLDISDGEIAADVVCDRQVGGIVLAIDHEGVEIGEPSAGGMQVLANDQNGVLRVAVYSLEGNTISSGDTRFLTIPILSGDPAAVIITEASSSDSRGELLETRLPSQLPIPSHFAVYPNYPNPFNARTSISFALPQPAHVTLDIFDLLGRSVETLIDNDLSAGYHSVVWNAGDRSSGAYFYKIRTGEFSGSFKMLLLK